ncbi:MAG TPA: hypothetical protein VFV67_01655 [Actinophytocola sp.]|nr:hypothetical protein [Actinophytocola sp.]HEU5469330.1 hypothetical protein [Actinophytocola sp.]
MDAGRHPDDPALAELVGERKFRSASDDHAGFQCGGGPSSRHLR